MSGLIAVDQDEEEDADAGEDPDDQCRQPGGELDRQQPNPDEDTQAGPPKRRRQGMAERRWAGGMHGEEL